MAAKDNDKGTEIFSHVLENFTPMPPSNVTLTPTLLQRPGGEMYGM
jgi:hypothetical protein